MKTRLRRARSMTMTDEGQRDSDMSSDPDDELAQLRARRLRGESPLHPSDADAAARSEDQDAAIERAREAWLLRRAGRDAPSQDDPPERE